MPRKTIANFELEYLQIMDETGSVDQELMPKIEKERLKELYKTMLLARTFDTKLYRINLKRMKKICRINRPKGFRKSMKNVIMGRERPY